MADARDLKSLGKGRAGSIPPRAPGHLEQVAVAMQWIRPLVVFRYMDPVLLSRIQFGADDLLPLHLPAAEHRAGRDHRDHGRAVPQDPNPLYQQMTKFWVRIFGLTFALGVATGVVMEFEFGTNWANYSRFVGDVFGSALAAEGIFAFFLESGFLAILLFGWNKVSPRMHFFSALMVTLGRALQRDLDRRGELVDADAGGLPHRGRGAPAARGDHRFLGDGLQSVLGGAARAHGPRRVAGRRVPRAERQRVLPAEEEARGVREGVDEDRAGRRG